MTTPFKYFSKTVAIGTLCLFGTLSVDASSLWLKRMHNERGMFADQRASDRGDIVTIVVNENFNSTNTLSNENEKDSTINNTVKQWLFSPTTSEFGTRNGELPSTDIEGSTAYESTGTLSANQSLQDRFSVMVIDRLPNGNLVLEGTRMITTSGQSQFVVLRGIVRSKDIQEDNTINSSMIADARIQYINEGALTDAQRKGWLQKVNDLVSPF